MSGSDQGIKMLSDNRRARHDYFLLEDMEAGMVLTGTEVKSIRAGKMQLREAYATIRDNEMWLFNAHISPYSHGNLQNHDPLRPRKLLLNRREINRLIGKTHEKGLTLIPTKSTCCAERSSAAWPWPRPRSCTTSGRKAANGKQSLKRGKPSGMAASPLFSPPDGRSTP